MRYEPFALPLLYDIITLGRAMQEESAFSVIPFSVERSAASIMRLIVDNPNGFGVLAYDEDKPVGMIAGSLNPYFFSTGGLASDYVWYILPEYRGSRTSIRLLNMFRDWAKERGASELYMGISTNVNADRTGQLLERMGFKHVGGNYKLALNVES